MMIYEWHDGVEWLRKQGCSKDRLDQVNEDWCWREFNAAFPDYRERFDRDVEHEKIENAAWVAHAMDRHGIASTEWAERIIESCASKGEWL